MAQYVTNPPGWVAINNTTFDVIMVAVANGSLVSNSNPLPVTYVQTPNVSVTFPGVINTVSAVIGGANNYAVNVDSNGNLWTTVTTGLATGANVLGGFVCYSNSTAAISGSNRLPVTTTAQTSVGLVSSQAAVNAIAQVVFQANTTPNVRKLVNMSANTVYVGGTSGVTSSNGFPVTANAQFDFSGYAGNLYAIVASGTATLGVVAY